MTEYKSGQKVHVDFHGVIQGRSSEHDWLVVRDDKTGYSHQIWKSVADRIVTKDDPESWPPEPGDLWKTDDKRFVVYKLNGSLIIRPADGRDFSSFSDSDSYHGRMNDFKELNPALEYRAKN